LVLDQGYSHVEASQSIVVGEALMRRWVQQLLSTGWRRADGGFHAIAAWSALDKW
jgi:transposase